VKKCISINIHILAHVYVYIYTYLYMYIYDSLPRPFSGCCASFSSELLASKQHPSHVLNSFGPFPLGSVLKPCFMAV
jgi:hypothetical protein